MHDNISSLPKNASLFLNELHQLMPVTRSKGAWFRSSLVRTMFVDFLNFFSSTHLLSSPLLSIWYSCLKKAWGAILSRSRKFPVEPWTFGFGFCPFQSIFMHFLPSMQPKREMEILFPVNQLIKSLQWSQRHRKAMMAQHFSNGQPLIIHAPMLVVTRVSDPLRRRKEPRNPLLTWCWCSFALDLSLGILLYGSEWGSVLDMLRCNQVSGGLQFVLRLRK